jgi:hypothetical protein
MGATMRRLLLAGAAAALALAACAQGQRIPRYATLALDGGASLLYNSGRRPRDDAADRALALQARSFFCAHYSDLACPADGTVYVSIVWNRSRHLCAIVVSGEKYRIANPGERRNGIAEADCFPGGRPAYFAETITDPGVIAILDGSMSWLANRRRLDGAAPVTTVPPATPRD